MRVGQSLQQVLFFHLWISVRLYQLCEWRVSHVARHGRPVSVEFEKQTKNFFDRTFSTVVTADWTYGRFRFSAGIWFTHFLLLSLDSTLDFDAAYAKVLASVLEVFAGPADKVRPLIFKIFDFPISGNLFPVCAAFTASYPASCPAEGSSGW